MPFQRVNSPLLEAASSLRPSGVHRTTFTGYLALFSEECKCRTGIESAGLDDLAIGGTIYDAVSSDRGVDRGRSRL